MKTEELIIKVTQWANDRNIIDGCPPIKQAYKTLEECGELIEAIAGANVYKIDEVEDTFAIAKYHDFAIKDAIGDITVTLIIQCAMQGIDFVDCLEGAYNTIKDRKGKLVDGKFVKEAEPLFTYCIEVQRESRDDDFTTHAKFNSKPSEQDVLDYLEDEGILIDLNYARLNYYLIK